MKVIVTGASGFIGKNLLFRLPARWKVVAVYHQSKEFPKFLERNNLKNITAVKCDLTDPAAVKSLVKKVGRDFDACVYLAANGNPAFSVANPFADAESNILALLNFVGHMVIRRFIFFSSGAVYAGLKGLVSPEVAVEPKFPYAVSKYASELYIKHFVHEGRMKEYVILRFFGAYGPYESERKVYTKLIKTFCLDGKGTFAVRGDGRNSIDAMYVDDAVDAVFKIILSKRKNLTVDFCSGKPLRIDALVKSAANTFGKNKICIKHLGTVPEYIRFRGSAETMHRLFGFRPRTSLREGLMKFAAFLDEQKRK